MASLRDPGAHKMKKILVLFPKDWDLYELSKPQYRGSYRFFFEGFDIHRFPENLRLLGFDARRWIDRLLAKYHAIGIDGVVSNNEHFGALIAAILADRLGLPGTQPRAVALAQHKYYAREVVSQLVPDATPRFTVFPYDVRAPEAIALPFPMYVKPVKATFSVLARDIADFAELRRHLSFNPLETLIIKRLVRPFNQLIRHLTEFRVDAHHMIGEEIMRGVQLNVDGIACHGCVELLGVVDCVMYPGTNAFRRFEYPSAIPDSLQARIEALTRRVIDAIGFDHGAFNVEFCYDPESDSLRLIEVNPRLASQLADLYTRVDGVNPYRVLLDLALGKTPQLARGAGRFARATSFVFRKFDGRALAHTPSAEQVARFRAEQPDAKLMLYPKRGAALSREMKWLGSHRYAVLNIGGASSADLVARYRAACRQLAFEPDAV
jgi:biotin carboxylase